MREQLPEDHKAAKRALAELKAQSALVFPGKRKTPYSGWSKSKEELDKACGVQNWRLHDLRRSLATGFQKLGVRLEVTEAILNHVSGSRAGIVGIYQRHDWLPEKTTALNAWATHVLALLEAREEDGNVTSFPTRLRSTGA